MRDVCCLLYALSLMTNKRNHNIVSCPNKLKESRQINVSVHVMLAENRKVSFLSYFVNFKKLRQIERKTVSFHGFAFRSTRASTVQKPTRNE